MAASWQPFIDDLLRGGAISGAAIVGHNGLIWAASPDMRKDLCKESYMKIFESFKPRPAFKFNDKQDPTVLGPVTDFVATLPPELSLHIFSFLDSRDLGRCCCVCKQWRQFAEDDHLWKRQYEQIFKEALPKEPTLASKQHFKLSKQRKGFPTSFSPFYASCRRLYQTIRVEPGRSIYARSSSGGCVIVKTQQSFIIAIAPGRLEDAVVKVEKLADYLLLYSF